MPRLTETRSTRLQPPASGQVFEWCSEVKGFGVRVTRGSKSYVVQFRVNGKSQRLTLGAVGVFPFEGPPDRPGARDLALAALNAARRGENPRVAINRRRSPAGLTLNGVWEAYEKAGYPKLKGVGRKRETTIYRDKNRYALHLEVGIGKEAASEIDTARVRRWLDGIGTEGQRSHALVMLKSLLSFAASRGLTKVHRIGIAVARSREVQNFYKPDELARLDEALSSLTVEKPSQRLPLSALRLLIATGARLGEILSLRWEVVDLAHGVIQLERDKTSENRRDILLTAAAVDILKGCPKTSSPFVFHSDSKSGHIVDLKKSYRTALLKAGLRRLRIHDLRHSFASAGIRQGVSLYTVGKLLGHRQATTTQRYAHLEQEVAREALDRIAKVTERTK